MSTNYPLGSSDQELQRLQTQGGFYGDLTADILKRAGIRPNMKVLDVGCGAGDVSLLTAGLVGPGGFVLGIDKSQPAVDLARTRGHKSNAKNCEFKCVELDAFEDAGHFDALVGRLVLPYLKDPAATLRNLTRSLKPGGIVAFAELNLSSACSFPNLPLFSRCVEWLQRAFKAGGVQTDMGIRLPATFSKAGLKPPEMILLGHVEAESTSAAFDILAESVRSLGPRLAELGIVSEAEIDVTTLSLRLKEEARSHSAVVIPPCIVGGWSQLPE
jgi:ubiquinone/menaquinone biosynthesis C-methylase UbiE